MFNNYDGNALRKLIPAEYDSLLGNYWDIRKERSKTVDLPGQLHLFEEPTPQ
jgi:hypothetical protein